MASTSPSHYNSAANIKIKHLQPLSFSTTPNAPARHHHRHTSSSSLLLLFFLLLLLLLSLALVLLRSFPSRRPPLLHHLLSSLSLCPLSDFNTAQLLQHHLTFLLSPFPIFILANLIIFTLLFKTFYLPSTDSSDFVSVKFDYGSVHGLPEHAAVPNHEDFFSSPPHAHYIVSSDPSEEYHVLSFGEAVEESTYLRTLQSFDKLNNEWQEVKEVSHYIDSRVLASKEPAKRQLDKEVMPEKVRMPIACKMSSMQEPGRQERISFENGKANGRSEEEAPSNWSFPLAGGGQAVIISVEPANRRPRASTPAPSNPPPLTPSAVRQPTIKVPLSGTTAANMLMAQRPPSSPRAKKSWQQTTGKSAAPNPDARSNGADIAKPLILDNDKQAAAKPQLRRSLHHQHQSSMVRSFSDHRLPQQVARSSDIPNGVLPGSSSLTNRPHVQKASHSTRGSRSAIDNLLTTSSSVANRPHMKRTQSLRSSNTPPDDNGMAPSSIHCVTRSPSFSEALDALSDADANKRFSNFIAHRFALMKKEVDGHST